MVDEMAEMWETRRVDTMVATTVTAMVGMMVYLSAVLRVAKKAGESVDSKDDRRVE